ncbi:alpha/beta fold hydrolase [Patescibacteria group bacterium]|nr:alpha/beta fold hydrolase [Patescibacteria group bacterium]MCL5733692.1 alpha/beta fold hydrolase [Patescibacteria group bacterium]
MEKNFYPCFQIEIITPKKIQLDGLWFGPAHSKRVIIFVHGLASTAFKTKMARSWVSQSAAVITFGNRGHDKITSVRKILKNRRGYKSILAGEAHEVFTDCADDIQGAVNFAKKRGAKDIYLAGHSTGCQKITYWASRKNNQRQVKGLILLAPLSDYSIALAFDKNGKLGRAVKFARALVKKGKKHELMPKDLWSDPLDAQRFLSLSTPNSAEEIFSYAQPKKYPRIFKAVKLPVMAILAEKDEYADRSAEKIANWLKKHSASKKISIRTIPEVGHSFHGAEKTILIYVKNWIKSINEK